VLILRRLGTLAVRSLQEFGEDGCSHMAAAISYYVLFSLFPLLIFTVGLLGIFIRDTKLQDDLVDIVLENIPFSEDRGRNDVTEAVRGVAGVGGGALGAFGLLGMAWSGSSMFGVIRRSLNTAFDVRQQRPLVRQKLIDLLMVLAFAPFFLVSIGLTAVLRIAQQASLDLPVIGGVEEALGAGWTLLSFLVPIGLSFLAFLVLFWVVPARRMTPAALWPGALLAAVLFEALKAGFTIYVANFSNYDVVFGSLGAVVAFLFWVYLSASVLLLGAEVASEYPRVMAGDYDAAAPRTGPALPLQTKAWHLVRGLFVHPPPDAPEHEEAESSRPRAPSKT
jgi:membrane protein